MAEADRDLVGEGRWLTDHRRVVDAGECEWLLALAEFDAAQGWAIDGMRSCVDWLRWRAKMGRSTAYEKVWIGAELRARPQLATPSEPGGSPTRPSGCCAAWTTPPPTSRPLC